MTIYKEGLAARRGYSMASNDNSPRLRYTEYSDRSARNVVLLDLVVLLAVGIATAIFRWKSISWVNLDNRETILIFLLPLTWFITLAWTNAWVFSGLSSPSELYIRVLRSGLATLAIVAGISFIFKQNFSRSYILISIFLGTLLLITIRRVAQIRFNRKRNRLQIKKQGLFLTLKDSWPGLPEVIMDFQESDIKSYVYRAKEAIITPELKKYLLEERIDFVISCAKFGENPERMRRLLELLDQLDIKLYLFDPLAEMAQRRGAMVQNLHSYTVMNEPRIQHSKALFKRAIDLSFGIFAFALFSPLMLLVAILVKTTSRGPIFYTDMRIGQGGELFKFPKFRSMRDGADKERLEILGRPDDEMFDRYKDDPRITKVGKIIRRFSIDELPQLWCVIIGTMSIVGPRPILREEISQLEDQNHYRQLALPGLTGLWQVSGRKATSWETRMEMDLKYINEWSPYLDFVLLARTIRVVLTGKGAY